MAEQDRPIDLAAERKKRTDAQVARIQADVEENALEALNRCTELMQKMEAAGIGSPEIDDLMTGITDPTPTPSASQRDDRATLLRKGVEHGSTDKRYPKPATVTNLTTERARRKKQQG